jgi:hypothetical protein
MRLKRASILGAALWTTAILAPGCSEEEVSFPEPPPEVQFEPAPGGMRRILANEYTRSIGLVLGPEAAAAVETPVDIAQEGFDAIGATILAPSAEPIEIYERSADAVAEAVLANRATLAETASCVNGGDDSCFTDVAEDVGRLLWRRPLEAAEVESLVAVADFAGNWAAQQDPPLDAFDQALKYELMAMLESPNFLYIRGLGAPDPSTGYRRLDAFELATRLSFFLLGRTPDAALLDLAEGGGLETEEQIRAAAADMLASDEAKVSVEVFYEELLRLRFLATAPKNAMTFPTWTPELAEAMRQETLLLVNDLVWERDADIRELFDADYTFVNDALAGHYGITPPGSGEGFEKVDWPAVQNRAGFTSQGSFLALQSGPLRNSPTKRGKFVLQVILCTTVLPPPDDVVPELPEPPPGGASLQELLEMHMDDPACASCHAQTDPIGFGYEFFDAIGRYRPFDGMIEVDGSGAVDGLGEWTNAAELGAVLAADPRTGPCVVKSLLRGKIGHTETEGELPAINEVAAGFAEAGHSMQSLLVEMASHPLFRYVNEPR